MPPQPQTQPSGSTGPSAFSALAAKFITQQSQSHRGVGASTTTASSSDGPLFYSTYSHKPRRRSGDSDSDSDEYGDEGESELGLEEGELAGGAHPGPSGAPMSHTGTGMGMGTGMSQYPGAGVGMGATMGMGGMAGTMGIVRGGQVDPFRGGYEGSTSEEPSDPDLDLEPEQERERERGRWEAGRGGKQRGYEVYDEEDEEEDEPGLAKGQESISLLPTARMPPLQQQHKPASRPTSKPSAAGGWRGYTPSRASSSGSGSEEGESDGVPPSYLLTPHKVDESSSDSEERVSHARQGARGRGQRAQGQGQADSMLESLLPQDQLRIRPSLGHVLRLPHAGYTVLFGVMLVVSTVLSLYALLFTPKSSPLPHLTHTLPLLTLLTGLSLLLPPIHIALLRLAVKPALYGTYFLLPVLVLVASLYSFAGSFWSQSLALRIISPLPLIPLLLTLPTLPRRLPSINRASALLQLSATLLLHHPSALASIMVGALLGAVCGGIIGGGGVRLVFGGSLPGWLACLPIVTTLLGYATLLSLRSIALGNLVGRWYLAAPPRSPPDQHESTRSAVLLATGPQFGTAVLGALILSVTRTLVWVVYGLQRLIMLPWLPIPPQLSPMSFLLYLIQALEGYNGKTMLLTGLNPSLSAGANPSAGGNFWATVAAVRALEQGRGRIYRNYDVTRTLLHLLVLLSSVLAALSAYFYSSDSSDSGVLGSAKWRERKAEDVWAAVLAGGLCWGLGEFGLGGLGDVQDALWMCFAMDLDAGREGRGDVAGAFEGRQERLANDVEGAAPPPQEARFGGNLWGWVGQAAGARQQPRGYAPVPVQQQQQQQQAPVQVQGYRPEEMPGESMMSSGGLGGMGGMGMSSGLFD